MKLSCFMFAVAALSCVATIAYTEDAEEVNTWYQAAKAQCLQDPITRTNAIREETCVSNALAKANRDLGSSLFWAADNRNNATHSAAVAFASGEISREEFITEYHAADVAYNDIVVQSQRSEDSRQQQNVQMLLMMNQAIVPQQSSIINCNTYRTGPYIQSNCY